MSIRHGRTAAPRAEAPARLPYPNGWFALAFGRGLPSGAVLRRRLRGEEIVLYRTKSGKPRAIRPYCPHLATRRQAVSSAVTADSAADSGWSRAGWSMQPSRPPHRRR